MNHDQIADVLDDAADYIEHSGWCQLEGSGPDGEACALNAVSRFTFTQFHASATALAESLDLGAWNPVARWNDAPQRTQQQVLDALRTAAKE